METPTLIARQAELMAAYSAHQETVVATAEARVKVSLAQSAEASAADAVANAEKALQTALESQPPEI